MLEIPNNVNKDKILNFILWFTNLTHVKYNENLLYTPGEKKWGTDESTFNFVMASRNHVQLRATFQAYQKVSFNCVIKVIYWVILNFITLVMLALNVVLWSLF